MSKFDDAIKDMMQKRDKAMKKACATVEGEAKLRAPVGQYPAGSGKTGGTLRRSISHDVQTDEKETVGRIGTNLEYAPYVELGTSKMKAQPYLKPAVEENLDTIKEIIQKELKV